MNRVDAYVLTDHMEAAFEWKKWREEIPYLQFLSHWKVKIVPPSSGAVVRFLVTTDDKNWISVYLDCYDMLGFYQAPYWEIYPAVDGDCERFPMHETTALLDAIELSLKAQSEKEKANERMD